MCYQPQLVLSDSLLKKYCNLSCGIQTKFYSEIKNLLSFYKQHVYNVEQYRRIGIPLDDGLKTALARNNNAKSLIFEGSLENLADYTLLKIILDDEKGDYPYVNINSDTEELKMNLTGCFKKNESRKKCIDHIKRLCKNARTIIIYDKYCESQLQKILNLVCNSNNELKL